MQATHDTTQSATGADALATVHRFFDAISRRDVEAAGANIASEATWNHRNPDRLGGVHRGRAAILGFIGESMQLTAGTLVPKPEAFMPDGDRRVAVLVHLTATRPDGRTADDHQMVVFTVEAGQIAAVEQFVGDPAAVAAFWA